MKKLLKITSIIIIQAFLLMDFAPPCGYEFLNHHQTARVSALSPQLNVSLEQFQKAFYVLQQRDSDGLVEFVDVKKVVKREKSFRTQNKIIYWLYVKLSKHEKFNELVEILGFVIKGEDAFIKIIVAAIVIGVNVSLDVPLINMTLKPAVIAWGIKSGNWYVFMSSLMFAQFVLGGLIRLVPLIISRIIFYKFIRLNSFGLLVNFISVVGNFAPLLFLDGAQPRDLWAVREIRKLSRLVKDSITKHSNAREDAKITAEKFAVEIAVAIGDCQSCFCEYDFNCLRFKVRGTTGYGYERLMNNITRKDLQDKVPFYFRIHKWIFTKFGIISPGYGKGTRPILLLDNRGRLEEIEAHLRENLSLQYQRRVYEFDIERFADEIQKQKDADNLLTAETIAKKCIKPMFDKKNPAVLEMGRPLTARAEEINIDRDKLVGQAI